ncbi:MAG TPA: TolC family protein [Chitinophagaceae bacterium]|nr:TolC family protein [Chitinophagaceae bacterium]
MIQPIVRNLFFSGIAVIILASCSVPSKTVQENSLKVPALFSNSDTAGIPPVTWKQYFTDTNLVKLVSDAIENNADLRIAWQRIIIAREGINTSKGMMLPSVSGVISTGVDKYGDYTMNGVGNYDTNLSPNIDKNQHIPTPTTDIFLGLKSTWEIDAWGKLKAGTRAAFQHYLATQKGRQWLTTQLVATVARLYYELMAYDNNMRIIHKNIQLQENALNVVKVQKEGGRATELAVQQFNAQLLHTKSFEFEVKQHITDLENQINILLGRFPQPVKRSDSLLNESLPSRLQAGIPSGLLENRADVKEASFELAASKANAEAARKAFFPSITLNAYAGFNAFNPSLLFSTGSVAYGLLGGLTSPLFNKKQLKANFAVANANQAQALYTYQKSILQAFGEVETSLQAIENNKHLYALKREEAGALTNAVNTANDLYLVGAASYLEVITAQKGVLDAELEVINGKKALLLATVDLYRALGGG